MQSVSLDTLAEQTDTIESELRAGHSLKLLRGGKRIGEINPAAPEPTEEERAKAWASMLAVIEQGMDLGGTPFTYEERHER